MSSPQARLFISYSRKDQAFVRGLHASLAVYDLWVDWEDIPPTADFIAEIERAIEGVDTFVFVISPDSVASPICRAELTHAVAHHKRLVPIVRRDTPTAEVPPELARLNWIFWREEDDLAQAEALLATAIATDFEWVRRHTALLVRALEWDAKGRSSSLLLHGSALREAEEWLARANDASDPQPTAIQRQYVLSGRRAANSRLGKLIGAAALATLIALILAVVAFVQRNAAVEGRAEAVEARQLAETQRDIAETQQRRAESRALAAGAVSQLPTDPELSLGLATEALSIAHTREAEDALRQGLGASHLRLTLNGEFGAVLALAYSPDGSTVLASGNMGGVRLWDAKTGETRLALSTGDVQAAAVAFAPNGAQFAAGSNQGVIRTWDLAGAERFSIDAHTSSITSLTFSPDGALLLSTSEDGTARIWNANDGAAVATLTGHEGTVWMGSFSPDGRQIVTGSDDGTAIVWNGITGELIVRLTPLGPKTYAADIVGDGLSAASFNSDGDRVLIASYDGTARIFDAVTGEQLQRLENNQPIGTVETFLLDAVFSPDGLQAVTSANDGVLRVWDTATGEKQMELRGHAGMVAQIVFSPDGRTIASVSYDGSARLWDARTGRSVAVMTGHLDSVMRVAFDPNGGRIVTGSYDGTVRIWEAGTGADGPAIGADDLATAAVALSPDGARIMVLDVIGTVTTYDAVTGEQLGAPAIYQQEELEAWNAGAFSPDRTRIAMAGVLAFDVVVWEPASSQLVARLTGHTQIVGDLTFSPDGRYVATASYDKTARIWDAETGELLQTLTHPEAVRAVAFSPDGRTLLTGADDFAVRNWDLATGRPTLELVAALGASLDDIAFSPDGARFIVGSGDNVARIWETATGTLLTELRGHTELVSAVSFSPDGRWALTASWDASARVWNTETGTPLETIAIFPGYLRWADFSADGRRLVTAPASGAVRISPCPVCGSIDELQSEVAARGTRPLTPEERNRYLEETATPVAS